MKYWNGTVIAPSHLEARHSDGRHAVQVHVTISARSVAEVMRLLNVSRGYVRDYMSEGAPPYDEELLRDIDGVALVYRSMSPHGTLRGDREPVVETQPAGLA